MKASEHLAQPTQQHLDPGAQVDDVGVPCGAKACVNLAEATQELQAWVGLDDLVHHWLQHLQVHCQIPNAESPPAQPHWLLLLIMYTWRDLLKGLALLLLLMALSLL